MSISGRRAAEVAALLAAGDGLTTALFPRGQIGLWKSGPRLWRRIWEPFEDHPQLTRLLAAGQAVAAVAIARRLMKAEEDQRA